MNFEAEKFGKRIASLRQQRQMTQEELADELGISWDYISKIEQGKRTPAIDLIISLSELFEISTDYLLLGRDVNQMLDRSKILAAAAMLTEIAGGMQQT